MPAHNSHACLDDGPRTNGRRRSHAGARCDSHVLPGCRAPWRRGMRRRGGCTSHANRPCNTSRCSNNARSSKRTYASSLTSSCMSANGRCAPQRPGPARVRHVEPAKASCVRPQAASHASRTMPATRKPKGAAPKAAPRKGAKAGALPSPIPPQVRARGARPRDAGHRARRARPPNPGKALAALSTALR